MDQKYYQFRQLNELFLIFQKNDTQLPVYGRAKLYPF